MFAGSLARAVPPIAAAVTNPWHLALMTPHGNASDPGPLGRGVRRRSLHAGRCRICRVLTTPVASIRRRAQSRMVASAAAIPAIAALAWAAREPLRIPLEMNPVPLACTVFVLCAAFQVFAREFAGIAPNAAELAFDNASEALIALDRDLVVAAVNETSAHLFPISPSEVTCARPDRSSPATRRRAWPTIGRTSRSSTGSWTARSSVGRDPLAPPQAPWSAVCCC